MKYTPEQETELSEAYVATEDKKEIVEKFAAKWQKSPRSIIAKLSKMGIYVSAKRISKVSGDKPKTKEQIVADLEVKFNVVAGDFSGLEKAPKLVLIRLLKFNVK